MLFHNTIYLFTIVKNIIFGRQECSNIFESNDISTIDIVVGGDHGQGKFWSVWKFIFRDILVKTLHSYRIKNTHIDCEKDTNDVLNESIVKPLNNEMKIIMNEDRFVFKCGLKIKIIITYSKIDDINESIFQKCNNNMQPYFNIWRPSIFCYCCWKIKYVWLLMLLVQYIFKRVVRWIILKTYNGKFI